jgi:hypothetical protein
VKARSFGRFFGAILGSCERFFTILLHSSL